MSTGELVTSLLVVFTLLGVALGFLIGYGAGWKDGIRTSTTLRNLSRREEPDTNG